MITPDLAPPGDRAAASKAKTPRAPASDQARARGDAVAEPQTLYGRLSDLLSVAVASESDLLMEVTRGLPSAAYTTLTDNLHINPSYVGSESTIRRRLQSGERFSTDESERMVRLARVHALAVELFGSEAAAEAWLRRPAKFVPDAEPVSPYELATRDVGARMVEALMLRAAHGIF